MENHPLIKEELKSRFQHIEYFFSKAWLEIQENHNPIVALWGRKDDVAKWELSFLDHALGQMKNINERWVKEHVKTIKGSNINNIKGAIFELILFDFLTNNKANMVPAKMHQAGYDGNLFYPNDVKANISVKNYGISSKQLEFQSKAKELKDYYKKLLEKYNRKPEQLLIIRDDKYPTESEWTTLHKKFEEIIKKHDPDKETFNQSFENWSLTLSSLSQEGTNPFDDKNKSYTILVSVPYHKNEEKNLTDKFEEACLNLKKQGINEDSKSINIIIIHLPTTISLNKCLEWGSEYLNLNPDYPVSAIIYYQPAVIVENGVYHLQHGINYVCKDSFITWQTDNGISGIPIKPIYGKISDSSSTLILKASETIEIKDKYMYQHGHHYVKPKTQNGIQKASVGKVAPGIYRSAVIYPTTRKSRLVSPPSSEQDELLIL